MSEARGRIAMVLRIPGSLDQLVYHVLRRSLVGIAHPEINDVLTAPARLYLHRVYNGKNIGRQPFDPGKALRHRYLFLFQRI